MGEKWIAQKAFTKALDDLKSRGIHEHAMAFLAMKARGVKPDTYIEYKSAEHHRDGFYVPYLKVTSTGRDRYYKIFDGTLSGGKTSSYPHSSQYTPLRQQREQHIRDSIEWEDSDPAKRNYKLRFKAGYIDKLSAKFFPDRRKIPLTALAVFLQARTGSVPDKWKLDDLLNEWRNKLHISKDELSGLFEQTPWPEEEIFSSTEFSPDDAARLILERIPTMIIARPGHPEPEMDWGGFGIRTDLVGLEATIEKIRAALKIGKHIVLLGPPGTGKTQLAEEVCRAAVAAGVPGYVVTTATADWSTFETIGGYLPDAANPAQLRFRSGLITECIDTGRWLVIDELNRADVDKAFGELFTLLSGKRVSLPFRDSSDKRYVILPNGEEADENEVAISLDPNWRLIGTMNSFDKASLFQLSFAFMRRFAFIEVPLPTPEAYKSIIEHSWPMASGDAYRLTSLALIEKVFSPNIGILAIAGVPLGPSIAIDVSRHMQAYEIMGDENEVRRCLLSALMMFVFPQLEGQDRRYKALETGLRELVASDERALEEMAISLRLWTGYEPGVE